MAVPRRQQAELVLLGNNVPDQLTSSTIPGVITPGISFDPLAKPRGHSIRLARRIPSQNQNQYRHWSHYRVERDLWFVLLRQHLPPKTPPTGKVRVLIQSFRSRLVDFANLVGGAKPIPDCLKRLGWIHDDSPDFFDCTYEQFKVPKSEERTEIHILD